MRFFRKMSRRLKIVLSAVLVLLLGAGGLLAFRIYYYGYPSEFGVYVMGADGRDPSRVGNLISLAGSRASWSPDGSKLALEANGDIYVVELASKKATRLTTAPELDFEPSFSPDGRTIAFSSERGGKTGIYLMSEDGSNQRALSTKDDVDPDWSPDGSQLIFDSARKGGPGLYLINPDGSGLRRLTRAKHYSGGQGSSDRHGRWSPDGSKIAFTSSRTAGSQIYVMNADGSGQRRLTKTEMEGEAMAPSWAPGGDEIVFQSGLGRDREIYVVDAENGQLRKITENRDYDGSPVWSRDGSKIAFVSTRGL